MSQLEIGVRGITLVPQATGYGLLIGLGVAFCAVILAAIKIQKAYLSEDSGTSEMFMVANRSVGIGLTASAVFSSWMWINETVFAAAMCYRFGLAVPLWWATGLCFQIALMAALGVLAKIRVPYAHTSLEIIKMRYGRIGHVVFIILNLSNNVFGCASMILTGSQLIYGISGMHFVAATILIPLGVVLYTAVGGLKATFLTDYLHTTIALILIMYFTLSILTHEAVGGLSGLYDKVMATAAENYIPGNYQGSLLTMKSKDAIIWGLILKFGNLALVVMDTAFWQKSFASEVSATVPGYNLAAIAIFGIPWGLGTVIGLTARAIHNTPIFPSYPGEFTTAEVNAGLVMPYTVKALIGDQGIVAFFVLLFMALTSTVSSSMIAVSSILSFDVYKNYVNPKADDKRLLKVSHLAVVAHAIFITGISLALNYGGADMTWIGYFRPILSCSGIIPLAFTLCWSGQTKLAAITSPILGFATGLAIWLSTAKRLYGAVNLTTTEQGLPALYGACGSFFSPAIYSILISRYRPYKFDWREFLRIELADEYQINPHASEGSEESSINDEKKEGGLKVNDEKHLTPPEAVFLAREIPTSSSEEEVSKAAASPTTPQPTSVPTSHKTKTPIPLSEIHHPFSAATLLELKRWYRLAWAFFVFIVLVTFVAWPMPLYRDYVFTKPFFSGWTTVAIAWQFFSFLAVAVYPLYDGRREIAKGARGVWRALKGWRI
ncbi:Sodium:solute symporter family-domain-containing protein [Annulohypoxylon nitens]|nr:Sodium:solute symporter family-domain-containing protein [Annulohypoxylon nitens]